MGKAIEQFCKALRVLVGLLMLALAVPVAQQVIARYTGLLPTYLWTEELATFLFVWVVMLGSMIAVWDGTHFDVQITPDAKSPLGKLLQRGFVLVLICGFGLLFAWYGIEYAKFGALQHTVMMRASKLWTHITVPLAGAAWAVFSAYRLYEAVQDYRIARRAQA